MATRTAAALALLLAGAPPWTLAGGVIGEDFTAPLAPAADAAPALVSPAIDLSLPVLPEAAALSAAEASSVPGPEENERSPAAQWRDNAALFDKAAWAKHEEIILRAVGAETAGQAEAWRQAAAAAFRADPAQDARSVIADAFLKTHPLDPERARRAWSLLLGGREPSFGDSARWVFIHDGKIHAAAGGSRRLDAGRWEKIPRIAHAEARRIETHGDRTFALWGRGSDAYFGDLERKEAELRGVLTDFVLVGGRPYVASSVGVLAQDDDGRWHRIWSPPYANTGVYKLLARDGKLYAATFSGVYARDVALLNADRNPGLLRKILRRKLGVWPKWDAASSFPRRQTSPGDRPEPLTVNDLAFHEGRMYCATSHGLYSLHDGVPELEFKKDEYVVQVKVFDGRLYAATAGGVFVKEGASWRELFSSSEFVAAGNFSSSVQDFAAHDGVLYIATRNGLFQRLLQAAPLELGTAPAPEPALSSRLSSTTGSVWSVLERWLARVFGLGPGTRAAEWIQASAEAMRQNPAIGVTAAMAAGLARLHPALKREEIARILSDPQPSFFGDIPFQATGDFVEHDGKLYAASTSDQLYVHDGLRFERVELDDVAKGAGRLVYRSLAGEFYVGFGSRIYVLRGGALESMGTLGGRQAVRGFSLRGGRLVVSTYSGDFVREGGSWVGAGTAVRTIQAGPWAYEVGPQSDALYLLAGSERLALLEGVRINQILPDGDRLLVAADNGLYSFSGRVWRRAFGGVKVTQIARAGEETLVVADGGLYRLDGTRADSGRNSPIRAVFPFQGELLATVSRDDYRLWRVYPLGQDLASDWQARAGKDIEEEIVRSRAQKPESGSGAIVDENGKPIFGGEEKP